MKTFFPTLLTVIVLTSGAALAFPQQQDEPLFPVVDQGRTVYIDRTGKVVLTVPYAGSRFFEGLARVSVNFRHGYIDRTGKLVIGPMPYAGREFSNGLAMVEGGEPCTYAETKQKYGYIDRIGTLVIPITLTRPCNYWGDDFYFTKEDLALTNIGDKWGFIDRAGKLVMQFDEAGKFSEGLAAAKVNGKFGYINSKGEFVIKPAFDQALPFSEGLAAVRSNDLWGFIDKSGKLIIAPGYKEVLRFSEGLAAVLVDEKKWEWATIDRKGKIIIPARQNGRTHFSNGLSRISVDREQGYIDKTGKIVIEPNFGNTEDFRDGLAYARLAFWRFRVASPRTGYECEWCYLRNHHAFSSGRSRSISDFVHDSDRRCIMVAPALDSKQSLSWDKGATAHNGWRRRTNVFIPAGGATRSRFNGRHA